MKPVFLLVTLLLSLTLTQCSKPAENVPNDFLIVPGVRVGSVTAKTTEKSLVKTYGRQNVIPAPLNLGKGKVLVGSMVMPLDLDVIWQDANADHPRFINLMGAKSKYKTSEGITLGTTLKELEQINGKPFTIHGFTGDNPGYFVSAGQGKLTGFDYPIASGFDSGDCKILVQFGPSLKDWNPQKAKAYKSLQVAKELSSDLPMLQEVNPVISRILVYIP